MRPAPAAVLLGLAAVLPARADLLYPKGGGAPVEGRVEDDGTSPTVKVRLPGGGTLSYLRDRVDRIERGPLPEEEYRQRLEVMAGDDVQAHLTLGSWCLGKGMRREAAERFQWVLRLSPGNAEALAALGYVQEQGIWMSEEEAHVLRGDRRHAGRWLAPAAYRAAWTREALDLFSRDPGARDRVRRQLLATPSDLDLAALAEALRSRSAPMRQLAIQALGASKDPHAGEPLLGYLGSKAGEDDEAAVQQALVAVKSPELTLLVLKQAVSASEEEVRLRLLRAVGALGDLRAGQMLGHLAIFGTSFPLRREAARALGRLKHPQAFEAICRLAAQGDAGQRVRASEALMEYGDLKATPFLILALDHRMAERAGGRARGPEPFQVPGGSLGAGGFSDAEAFAMAGLVDPSPKVAFDERLPEVQALERLTGQNFGMDVARWRAWWTSRK